MAFGDTVRADDVTGVSGDVTVTYPSAPTAGNLLIVLVGRGATHGAGGAWGVPDGWNKVHDSGINVGNVGGALFWKIAVGDESGFASVDTNPQGAWQVSWAEFEGSFEASPLDVSAENADNLATVVTSQTSGVTGITAQNDELAIACWVTDRMDTCQDGRSYSNLFTEVIFSDDATARPAAIIAKKVLSATGTVESTFTTTDTGDEMYGVVATFKKSGGALATRKFQRNSILGV